MFTLVSFPFFAVFFSYSVVLWLQTFTSYSGGKWQDHFSAVDCFGEKGAQSQGIFEEKAGGSATSQKITYTG